MRLSEDKVRRVAERVVDSLSAEGFAGYTDTTPAGRAARVKTVYDVIIADLRLEEDIDAEVDRILGTYSRSLKPVEQDVLRRKHKDEVARKRGFIL